MVLIGTTHHNFVTAKCRHIDSRIHHLPLTVTGDAVITDDINITVHLGYSHNDTISDKELMNTAAVLHGDLFTIATLPKTAFAVLEHLVVIPVTSARSIAIWNFMKRIS